MKCAKLNCNGEGIWCPIIVARAPIVYEPCDPIRAQLGLRVCHTCKESSELKDFLSPSGWQMIVNAVVSKGKAAPDRARTTLDWELWEGSLLQSVNRHSNS